MLDRLAVLLKVSPTVVALLLVLAVTQLTAQVYALVDLARRPAAAGGRKWVWVLVVALGNLPGAIAYLAVGRRPAKLDMSAASTGASTAGGEAARRAVDVLYNQRDRR